MLHTKLPTRWSLPLLAVLASLVAAGGCTDERKPRSFVQPNAIKVKDLEGTWYYAQTVLDAPPSSSAAFIGLSSDLMKIKFDVQEDTLYARRAYEQISGSEDTKTKDAKGYLGQPLAAWKISKRFDIIREYNATTGEESNKIVESEERPWTEREFVRVDWSKNLTNGYAGLGFNEGGVKVESVSYWESDPGKPEAIHFERADKDGPEFLKDEASYFDLTNKVVLTPQAFTFCFGGGSCFEVPACWLSYQLDDCSDSVVKVRHSFAKVSPKHDYEPRNWDGKQMELFGLWDVGLKRLSYNRQYGVTNSGINRFAARFNVWKKSYDVKGNKIPYADREIRTTPYYADASIAAFPDDLFDEGQQVIDQWNAAVGDAVKAVRGKAPDKPIFVWCHNPVKDGDPAACREGLAVEKGPDGKDVYRARQGDPRRSRIFWVNQFQAGGPLGYGPPMFDPETGETISGQSYIYGGSLDSYATRGRDLVLLVSGQLKTTDYLAGTNVADWVNENNKGITKQDPTFAPDELKKLIGSMDFSWAKGLAPGMTIDTSSPKAFAASFKRKQDAIFKTGIFGRGQADLGQVRRDRARGSAIEALMVTPDRLLLGNGSPIGSSWNTLDEAEKARVSPLRSQALQTALRDRQARLEALGYDFAEFADEGVAQRALRMAAEKKSFDPEQVWRDLRGEIFLAVTLHEVGHNVGLRHNFRGSYDVLNYHPEYWRLREAGTKATFKFGGFDPRTGKAIKVGYGQAGCTGGKMQPRYLDCPGGALSVEEAEGGIREYQYSSVMDYGSDFNSDLKGLGHYDKAAMKFAYAGDGYVEVFSKIKSGATATDTIGSLQYFSGSYGFPSPLLLRSQELTNSFIQAVAYTSYAERMFNSIEDIEKREDVPYAEIAEAAQGAVPVLVHKGSNKPMVPYYFCGDEYAGNLTCQRYDSGADAYEQARDIISRYENYYLLNNFKRDRYTFYTSAAYLNNIAGRYMAPLRAQMTWYTLFRTIYTDANYPGLLGKDGLFEAPDQWGSFSVAVAEGFDLFGRILSQPEPGIYRKQTDAKVSDAPFDGVQVTDDFSLNLTPELQKDYFKVGIIDGKYSSSTWDFQTCGYYWADECQSRIGYILDKTLALEALTDSQAYFTGRDTSTDVRLYAIGYVLPFKNQLMEKFGAILANDYRSLSPGFDDKLGLQKPRWSITDPRATRPGLIDPATGFTVQIFAGVYGLTGFPSTFDQTFVDATRVFVVGNGEAPVSDRELLPASGVAGADATFDPAQLVSAEPPGPKSWLLWTDVQSGKTYAARAYKRTSPAYTLEPGKSAPGVYRIDVAARMLEMARGLQGEVTASCGDVNAKPESCENRKRAFENYRQNIDIMRSLHNAFGYARFAADAPFFY